MNQMNENLPTRFSSEDKRQIYKRIQTHVNRIIAAKENMRYVNIVTEQQSN